MSWLAVVCVGSVVAASVATPVELAFDPNERVALRVRVECDEEWVDERSTVEEHGRTRDRDQDRRFRLLRRLEYLDQGYRLDAGQLLGLRRRYVEIHQESHSTFRSPGREGRADHVLVSDLEGHSVDFRWREDERRQAASSPTLPDERLAELTPGPDLGALVPGRAVAPGERWALPCDVVMGFLRTPGGLRLRAAEQPRGSSAPKGFAPGSVHRDEGAIEAELGAVEVVDGVLLARIRLEGRIRSTGITQWITPMRGGHCDVEATTTTEQLIEGELLWDIAARRPRSLVLEGELERESSSFNRVLCDGEERQVRYTSWAHGQRECVVRIDAGPRQAPPAR